MELRIEYLPITALKPYKNNARSHAEVDVSAIAESIKEFGFDDPIGIWGDDNLIVEGHGRLLAAQKLDMDSVPCIRLDHLTDEQRRAYALAHNRTAELSEWDDVVKELELRGIKDIDMSLFGFGAPEPEVREDDYNPEPPQNPQSKYGEIYQCGRHRVMCGDSTRPGDVAALMGDAVADMLLTDPPYNVDVHENAGTIMNDNQKEEDFREFLTSAFKAACGKMRGGAASIFGTPARPLTPFLELCARRGFRCARCLFG